MKLEFDTRHPDFFEAREADVELALNLPKHTQMLTIAAARLKRLNLF